jgi:hypothetical protein
VARKRKPVQPATPPVLYSLSQRQAQWLTDARDTVGGAYVPVTEAARDAHLLVEAGAAQYREVRQSSGTRGPRDPRPCEWTDTYIVPTEHGLELLRRHNASR